MADTRPHLRPYLATYDGVSIAEWSYLAGIVDGEGSFYVCYDKRNDNYFLEMSVANTARSLIDWLKDHFGGTEKPSGQSRRMGCPSQWAWVVRGRKAEPIILRILPYLVIKRRQADLALEFIGTYNASLDKASANEVRSRIKSEISGQNCLKGKAR